MDHDGALLTLRHHLDSTDNDVAGPWHHGVSILEFRGDKVARETIYFGEAWTAPDWRAPWRAAPPPGQA